jgi:hypothetical protein
MPSNPCNSLFHNCSWAALDCSHNTCTSSRQPFQNWAAPLTPRTGPGQPMIAHFLVPHFAARSWGTTGSIQHAAALPCQAVA